MPFCAVRTCGESGQFACKKSEGQIISFHRFPSDTRIKAKWIRSTGQRKTKPSWRPTKASTICSKHFKKEDFLTCTDLKISAVPISEEEQEIIDGFMKDSVDNSYTDSVNDIIELPQPSQSITSKKFTEQDEEILIEYEPAPTTSPQDQPESSQPIAVQESSQPIAVQDSSQPIAVQDSEPEFSETSSELEFTELDSSEAKSGQLSVDAIENPQESDEQPAYGMKISKAYSTRKRSIVQMTDQMKTNIKMYRIDPLTNTVHPVTVIPKDSFIIDSAKPPVIIRQTRDSSEKPIYLMKKSTESLDGNSQKTKANQNCSSPVQYATKKNIAPETGSNSEYSDRVITLSMNSEEQKKVYSTPVPKLAQINQELPAKKADIVNTKANQNRSLQVQYANSTTKNIAPKTGSNSNGVITLSMNSGEQKMVYSTPVSKLVQINQELPAKKADIVHTKANKNRSSQVQYANSTTKNIAPKTGSNSNRVITLSLNSEEEKMVYSTPIPKLAQISQELAAKKSDIVKKISKTTKLNPTMETDGRVKKHRKVKIKSIIKKMTPSANMLTAPDGCCEPQLKLALWNVSKPKPTVSRLESAVPRPNTPVTTPADSTPTSTVSTPSPAYSMPKPGDSMPKPADSMLIPADSMLIPADSIPTPADSTPTPADSTPSPDDSMPIPADSTPTPADSMPTPTDSMPTPATSMPIPADLTPSPADSMPTPATSMPIPADLTPSPAASMPIPADSTPSPADSMPISADSTPSPADSTPTPADSMPTPADSMPIPADLTPSPAAAMPIPADSTPSPADSTPSPADSTPSPADSAPTPADSTPIPAVSSPAVQKLDNSNIHTLDEYDTFAKHVATQLRQLSLESYVSAQGEIQSTLSRYRLFDLNLIKKNHNL